MARVKLVLCGDVSVGKSALLLHWSQRTFLASTESTIGAEMATRTVMVAPPRGSQSSGPTTATASESGEAVRRGQDTEVAVDVWDTAGQEAFLAVIRSYYRGAAGAVLVYDLTRRSTLERIKLWFHEVESSNSETDIQYMLLANKSDLESEREVRTEEGAALAAELGMSFAEVSAKELEQVDAMFDNLISHILYVSRQNEREISREAVEGVVSGHERGTAHQCARTARMARTADRPATGGAFRLSPSKRATNGAGDGSDDSCCM